MRISDWSSDVCSSDLKGLALVLVGKASVSSFTTASGKSGRRATFTKVSAVQPQSPVLDRRIASRLRYVREGWHRPITNKERQEYRAEVNAALIRAGKSEVRAEQGAPAFAAPGAVEDAFARPDRTEESGVGKEGGR